MAGNTRFHSKHHAEQHHSVRTKAIDDYPDAATDPIGHPDAPYQGYLYVNGCLNVDNQLAADDRYNVFSSEIASLAPYNIFNDAILINDDGMKNGDIRSTPAWWSFFDSSCMVFNPPIPEPIATPARSRLILLSLFSIPACLRASLEAVSAYCINGSYRLSSFFLK